MPSRPASINLFSNPIGSLSFHPIIPTFGVNVHNKIAPKDVEEEFAFFASNFNGSYITKIGKKKLEFWRFLGIFSKSFCVWKMAPVGHIFGPQIGPK